MNSHKKLILGFVLGLSVILTTAWQVGIGRETSWSQTLKLATSSTTGIASFLSATPVLWTGSHSFANTHTITGVSANDNPILRVRSTTGLPQFVLEDIDATDAQEPFIYFQSANSGSVGQGFIGFADRSGTNLVSNTDLLKFGPTIGLQILGATPIANTKITLGIQVGSGTTADDGTLTNTFGTAFSSPPYVVVQVTGGGTVVRTNAISAVTTTNFVLNLGSEAKTFDYHAIGAP